MAISKFTPQSAKKDTGRTIGDNEVAKLANLNKIVTEVNTIFSGTANQLLAANGSTVTAGENITIAGGVISASGGGSGSSFTITTVGTLGTGLLKWSWDNAIFPSVSAGTQILTPIGYPTIEINGGMGGFTGTLSSVTISDLTYINLNINGVSTLTTVNLPDLTTIAQGQMGSTLTLGYNSSLTTINIPSLTNLYNNAYIDWGSCAFTQATVDHILVKFAGTTAINGTLQLNGGTSAAPSATGLAAKATLQGRGWSVNTN